MKIGKKTITLLAFICCSLSLYGCGNQNKQSSAQQNSSLKKQNKKLKHDIKKNKKKKSSSSSSASTSSVSSSNSTTQTSNANNSRNSDPKLADGTDVYSLPLSDPRNPDSYKQGQLMDIAADPKYHNPDGSMNAEGDALASSIEATFHQPQP